MTLLMISAEAEAAAYGAYGRRKLLRQWAGPLVSFSPSLRFGFWRKRDGQPSARQTGVPANVYGTRCLKAKALQTQAFCWMGLAALDVWLCLPVKPRSGNMILMRWTLRPGPAVEVSGLADVIEKRCWVVTGSLSKRLISEGPQWTDEDLLSSFEAGDADL